MRKKHAKGQAFTLLAQKLARAVYSRLNRKVAFETDQCFQGEGRGADAPEASLANKGMTLQEALHTAACLASVHAQVPRGHHTLSPLPLLGHPRSRLAAAALVANGLRVLLLTRAWRSLDNAYALRPIFA